MLPGAVIQSVHAVTQNPLHFERRNLNELPVLVLECLLRRLPAAGTFALLFPIDVERDVPGALPPICPTFAPTLPHRAPPCAASRRMRYARWLHEAEHHVARRDAAL